MRRRGTLAALLSGAALAALLGNPLPAEAHKVIIEDEVMCFDTILGAVAAEKEP